MSYDEFKPIVDIVLNNWTALQLAVEHGMGAPGGKKTAQLMSVYVAKYCVENGVIEKEDLAELLEDLMDEEFETVCHDNSPKEVAVLLIHFLDLIKEGRRDQLCAELNAMPQCQLWLCQSFQQPSRQGDGNPNDVSSSSSSDDDESDTNTRPNACADTNGSGSVRGVPQEEPMDEDPDPGWTVVRGKKKK